MNTGDSTSQAGPFLPQAEVTAAARDIFGEDIAEVGFVMNVSRLWSYQPETVRRLFELMGEVTSQRPFTLAERGVLVTACASALGDSCCSLEWGTKLARETSPRLAAGIIREEDDGLTEAQQAMAAWARLVARDPNRTTASDVARLRQAGFSDADIFAMTVYVALRVAFSTVNDALGVSPDAEYRSRAPAAVLDAVDFGRPVARGS